MTYRMWGPLVAACLCVPCLGWAQPFDDPVDLRVVRERAVALVEDIKTYRAQEVVDAVTAVLEDFEQVADLVLSAPVGEEDQYWGELIGHYERSAQVFREIDGQRDEILAGVEKRLDRLASFGDEVVAQMRMIDNKELRLDVEALPPDAFKRDLAERQRESLRRLYGLELSAFEGWMDRFAALEQTSGHVRDNVDKLLFVVGLSIPIYEEAAYALRVNQDFKDTLLLFDAQEEIGRLTEDVVASWLRTESLIDRALEDVVRRAEVP